MGVGLDGNNPSETLTTEPISDCPLVTNSGSKIRNTGSPLTQTLHSGTHRLDGVPTRSLTGLPSLTRRADFTFRPYSQTVL